MAFDRDWNESQPTDTTYAVDIDDYNRYLRVDMSDRLKNMIYGFIAGENSLAQHFKYLEFYQQSSSPSQPAADFARMYVKAVSNVSELFWRDDTNSEVQLTSGGNFSMLDEDDMTSNSATRLATQQSIKAYADDKSVDGTPTAVYTKYLTGTLDGTSPDTIAHGVADYDKILAVSLMLGVVADSKYYVWDYASGSVASAFYSYYGATNITIVYIGAFASADTKYRIKIDYIL